MRSPAIRRRNFGEQWLIDACSSEIRVHRLLFFFVLSPLLCFWLPYLMFYLGLYLLIVIQASVGLGAGGDGIRWSIQTSTISIVVPLSAALFGAWRESQRLRIEDHRAIASGIKMPEREEALLVEQLKLIWDKLQGDNQAPPPRLICRNFGVWAHAYDRQDGQIIEVGSGLADRVVHDDPLAISILRHELAHLVYADLPAIRKQSIIAGAAIFSADVALVLVICALAVLVVGTGLAQFPSPATTAKLFSVRLAILIFGTIVMLPLLCGRMIARRYAGFIDALIEMRADVIAGIGGEGLAAFSSQIKDDSSVRASTISDFGLAYISPFLSHLPTEERVAFLRSPERLATPKLRYFAVTIVTTWLLNFHQGSEIWDFFLLSAVVALLQALTVQMILSARRNIHLTLARAVTLATGLLASQALPLISLDGLAWRAEYLTGTIMSLWQGGNANYVGDIVGTFQEFGRSITAATGHLEFGLSVLLTTLTLWLMSRLPPNASTKPPRVRMAIVIATAFIASITVSYKFFQEALFWPVLWQAFKSS